MHDLRLHAVVTRVVAWHNSHPLARRITAAEVNSVGYVALPYTAPGLPPSAPPALPEPQDLPPPVAQQSEPPPAEPVAIDPVIDPVIETDDPGAIVIDVDPEPKAVAVDDSRSAAEPPPAGSSTPAATASGSSLRARMAARDGGPTSLPHAAAQDLAPLAAMPTPGAPLTLVCSEDFMAPWPIKQVLDWVRTHGVVLQRDPADGPVRQLPVDAALLPAGAGVAQLWVATATIEVGGQRHQLLLGGGELPALLGRRVWSPPRLLGAVATPCALVAFAVWWMWPAAPTEPITPATALPTVAVAAEPVALAALAAAVAAGSASSPEASASAAAVDTEPRSGGVDPPRLPGLLDEAAKAQARATVAALRAERQASTPAGAEGAATAAAPTGWPPATAVPAPSAAQPAPPPAVLYGLSTRLLRTRAEAEQLQSAFQALLAGTAGSALRVEMLPAGEDWRVVCWPYEKRADAERARAVLQARGLRVELVDF